MRALAIAMAAAMIGLGAAAATSDARADQGARPSLAVTWAAPAWGTMGQGALAPVPEEPAPARIPGKEHVAGFALSGPEPVKRPNVRHIRSSKAKASASQAQAMAYLTAEGTTDVEGTSGDTCFEDATSAASLDDEGGDGDGAQAPDHGVPSPLQWGAGGMARLAMSFDPSKATGAVRAVHAERWVPGAEGRASLDVTDAWVDPRTRGARGVAHYVLPFVRIFRGPNGLEVYAMRDRRVVQVVVRAPTAQGEAAGETAQAIRTALRSFNVQVSGGVEATSDCGHLRFALRAEPGAAEMATLRSVAYLPRLTEAPPPDLADVTTLRHRPFQLSVSATQLASDAEPRLSVSLGWTGSEAPGTEPTEPEESPKAVE